MPFKSRAQEKWAFANHMPFAKRWGKMSKGKKLPNRVTGTRSRRRKRR